MQKSRKVSLFFLVMILAGCEKTNLEEMIDCNASALAISLVSKTDPTGCNTADGAITVSASQGESPYTFILGASTNTSGAFSSLPNGDYAIMVRDALGCERTLEVSIASSGSDLAALATTSQFDNCLSPNGSISVTASGGTGPYEYQLNSGAFASGSSFGSLKNGSYTVTVKDAVGCTVTVSANVGRGDTGVSFANDIKPIIDTRCALSGCHNGDNGATRNWTVFDNVKTNAQNIKTRTSARIMPPAGATQLTQTQIDLIACWVDDGANNN